MTACLLVPAGMTLVKACLVVLVALAAAVLAMTVLHVWRHWDDDLPCDEGCGCNGDGGPEGQPPGDF